MLDFTQLNKLIESQDPHGDTAFSEPGRILWIDPDGATLVTISVREPARAPVSHDLRLVETLLRDNTLRLTEAMLRPYANLSEDEIPEKYKTMMAKAWEIIAPLVDGQYKPFIFFAEHRGGLVEKRAAELGIHPKQVRRYLFRYWSGGSVQRALIPHYDMCGPQGCAAERKQKKGQGKKGKKSKIAILTGNPAKAGVTTADFRPLMMSGINKFYKGKATISSAWNETIRFYFNKGYIQKGGTLVPIMPEEHEVPSYKQFYRLVKELDADLALSKRRAGTRKWNLKLRGVLGTSRKGVFGPCARFEIDATLMDIYLVSVFNRAWVIGRPILYVVIDVFSSVVVGFYLGLEGPSWEGARLALFNAFTDKVEFCKRFGVEIAQEQWPCNHLPHYLLADNGELLSHNSDELVKSLGIDVENTATCRGDWKPNVEQQFNLINVSEVNFLPGSLADRESEVRKRKYVYDSCLTIPELTGILIRSFLKHNSSKFRPGRMPPEMLRQNVTEASHLDIWAWGMKHLTGAGNQRSAQEIWTNLLPRAKATVYPNGIHFQGRRYSNEDFVRDEVYAQVRKRGKVTYIDIRHCSYMPEQIWIRDREGMQWKACDVLDDDPTLRDARLEEIQDRDAIFELKRSEHSRRRRPVDAEFDAKTRNVVAKAKKDARDAREGMTKAEIVDGISVHRGRERTAMREDRAKEHRENSGKQELPNCNVINMPVRQYDDPLDEIWEVPE